MKKARGKIWLAGAGPGDPGLLTQKAAQALAKAQVVVFDYLANDRILDLAPQAKKIDAGKRAGNHKLTQDQTNALLVKLGRQGKRVVRLKGGDPFVFGRGGEEAQALAKAGVPFEMIPGISSGMAGPAYAGIPVTQRGVATQVTFTTGQEKKGKPLREQAIRALAALPGTLVLFMSQHNIEALCKGLIKAGKKPGTPAAAVHQGTWAGQRCIESTLKNLPADVEKSGLGSPMLFVIGDVVNMRRQIRWFDNRVMSGKKILVTRASAQASRLTGLLEDLGAEVLEIPTLRIRPRKATPKSKAAIKAVGKQDWLILSSVNGVSIFFEQLRKAGLDSRALGGVKVAAIGPATAKSIQERGIRPDLIPQDTRAEGMLKALKGKAGKLKGLKILLARAAQGRDLLPEALKKAGAKVSDLALYDTSAAAFDKAAVLDSAQQGAEAVVFTSASTVRNFLKPFDAAQRRLLTRRLGAVCIGPVTAAAAREAGFEVAVQSRRASLELLAKAMERHWSKKEA